MLSGQKAERISRIFWVTTLIRMTSPLTDQVRVKYADLPVSWLDTLWLLVRCILIAQTTNLARLKDHAAGVLDTPKAQKTKPQSHYKRLVRFFDAVGYSDSCLSMRLRQLIAELTLRLIGSDRRLISRIGRTLLLDGTEWKIRGSKVQFLTLAILFDGVAIPIAFIDLEKIGHSSQQERIKWFKELFSKFDIEGMTLIADREYIGLEWFKALRTTFKLEYIVRIKKGIYHDQVNAAAGKNQAELVGKLRRCKKCKIVSKRIELNGTFWYYIVLPNPRAGHPEEDDFIFLLTSLRNRKAAAQDYCLRWSIEVTFRHLKSNGFRLEDMKIEGRPKREMMMAILNLVFVLCVIEGRKFYHRKPKSQQTKIDHKTGRKTLVHTIFRQGLCKVLATFNSLEKLKRRMTQIFLREPIPDWAFV